MLSVHLENGRVEIRRRPRPRRREGYALIRLITAGICNTDLELQRGYYHFRGTPGHEFVGEVVEADTPKLIGRRVVGEINIACGRCDWCNRGLGRHCPHRTVLGIVKHPGAFSEFFTLPEVNLHVVPDSVSTEQAVFTEPLAAACEILEQVRIPRHAPVAVLGDGKLGLLVAQVLQAHSLKVHLYGKRRKKPASPAYDWVVEATGSAAGADRSHRHDPAARHGDSEVNRPRRGPGGHRAVVVDEITLLGSRCGRFEPALKLLRTGKVKVEKMISARMPLEEAARAFEHAARPGVLKVLLEMSGV